jgi:hypothetical protein
MLLRVLDCFNNYNHIYMFSKPKNLFKLAQVPNKHLQTLIRTSNRSYIYFSMKESIQLPFTRYQTIEFDQSQVEIV